MFGGTSISKDVRVLAPSSRLDVLVATPGRLVDHLQSGRLGDRLKGLRVLVLDEGDRLLDQGDRGGRGWGTGASCKRAARSRFKGGSRRGGGGGYVRNRECVGCAVCTFVASALQDE